MKYKICKYDRAYCIQVEGCGIVAFHYGHVSSRWYYLHKSSMADGYGWDVCSALDILVTTGTSIDAIENVIIPAIKERS